MELGKVAMAAAIAISAASAQAVTHNLGDMTNTGGFSFASEAKTAFFMDGWDFTVTQESYITFSVVNSFTSIDAGYIQMGASFGGIGFQDVPFAHYNFGPTAHGYASTKRGIIGPGSWSVGVTGEKPKGGTGFYGGSVSITPVPEPSTYALLLAGVAAVGHIVSRRKR